MRALKVVAASWCLTFLAAGPAAGQVDQARAQAYFEEAAALCTREGGRLWGVSLCGPMVFADAVTGTLATSEAAPEGARPRTLGFANTAVEWGGRRWSTFIWQLIPRDDSAARGRLMLHELFHRVQPQLGLFVANVPGDNEHLDTLRGRYWMQLEWRALARALGSTGEARTAAVRDALAFRQARRREFPGSGDREQPSEINEGLPQYTATVAVATSSEEAAAAAIEQLTQAPEKESFVRTFSYPSGAAYGMLLDLWSPDWRRSLTSSADLGRLLMNAAQLEPAPDAEAAALKYGGPALLAAEETRAAERAAYVASLRRRFLDGPVLVVPRGRGASFITTGMTPIPGAGMVYPQYRVTGEWGSLDAAQVLVSPDGATLTLPGPVSVDGSSVSGEGWTVTLAPGWVIEPGPREGDRRVVRGRAGDLAARAAAARPSAPTGSGTPGSRPRR